MSDTPQITVLVIGPDNRVQALRVAADYREFNRLVNGSIASCPLPGSLRARGFYAYCDDEGMLRPQPPNHFATHLGHAVLYGPIVLFRTDGSGDELSLTVEDVAFLLKYFKDPPTLEAYAMAEQNRQFWEMHPSGVALFEIPPADLRGTLVAVCTQCDWRSSPARPTDRHETDTGHLIRYAVEG